MIKVSGKYVNMLFGSNWILHDKYFLVKREYQSRVFQFNYKFEKSINKFKDKNFVIKNSMVLGTSELSDWIDGTLHRLVDVAEQSRRRHKVTPVFRSSKTVAAKKYTAVVYHSKDNSVRVGIDQIYDALLLEMGIKILYHVDKPNIPLFTEDKDIFVSDIQLGVPPQL